MAYSDVKGSWVLLVGSMEVIDFVALTYIVASPLINIMWKRELRRNSSLVGDP
jgi:hypothetical protein